MVFCDVNSVEISFCCRFFKDFQNDSALQSKLRVFLDKVTTSERTANEKRNNCNTILRCVYCVWTIVFKIGSHVCACVIHIYRNQPFKASFLLKRRVNLLNVVYPVLYLILSLVRPTLAVDKVFTCIFTGALITTTRWRQMKSCLAKYFSIR